MHVDLHMHTTESDGRLTPTQLVDLAASNGARIIAITDHDSTQGLAEAYRAAEKHPQLTIIPGIELSTDIPGSEVHILGYFLDYKRPAFQDILNSFREAREDRGRRMVDKLTEMGMPISWDRVRELAGGGDGAVGRPHVAQAMVEEGYVPAIKDAFDLYIGRTGPAYAERPKLTPPEAVKMIKEVGGLAVMAHPKDVLPNLEPILEELSKAGLAGMEAHYQGYEPGLVKQLVNTCNAYDIIPCGGSDFHGFPGRMELGPGQVDVPWETAERLYALKGVPIAS